VRCHEAVNVSPDLPTGFQPLSPTPSVISGHDVALPLQLMGSPESGRCRVAELTGDGRREDVAKEDRGFASMDRVKQREIASKGGKAAHQKGTAHEWTSEEARDAGRKGGLASHQRRREQQLVSEPGSSSMGPMENQSDMSGDRGEFENSRSESGGE
jgi:uncharacterized protein